MKTKLISLLLSCVMLISLAACASENPGSTSEETTRETTAAQTTEEVTTLDDTTAEETTDVPSAALAFNEDLLSDIGLTYSELVEKHGEKVEVKGCEGGIGYVLENGYGAYAWGLDELDYGRELQPGEGYPLPRDASVNILYEDIQLPDAEQPCRYIFQIEAKDAFVDASFPLNVSEIQSMNDISNYSSGEDGIATPFKNYLTFEYDKVNVSIYYNDTDTIDSDSRVDIRIS